MSETIFKTLNDINVNGHTENKGKLTYLSWSWAWAEVKKAYPSANYTVDHYEGKPYLYDANLGYMVSTVVNINGEILPMHLPVMDGANKSMKSEAYTYKTKFGEKTCDAASMFDINKTIMRCLVKNLAMFGLGLYIYAGEDLPEVDKPPTKEELAIKAFEEAMTLMVGAESMDKLGKLWSHYKVYQEDKRFVDAKDKRKAELTK